MGKLSKPEPVSHPIVDTHLEAACANSGQHGSSAHMVAETLLVVTDQLKWRARFTDREDEPDMAVFSRNFTSVEMAKSG